MTRTSTPAGGNPAHRPDPGLAVPPVRLTADPSPSAPAEGARVCPILERAPIPQVWSSGPGNGSGSDRGRAGSPPLRPPGRLRRLLGAHRRLLGRSGTEPELPRTDRAGTGGTGPGAALMWRWSVMPDYLPPIEVTNHTPALHRMLVPGEVCMRTTFLGHSRELPDVPYDVVGPDAGGDPAHALVDSRTMDPRRVPRPRLVNRVGAGAATWHRCGWLTEHPDWAST